MSQLAAPPSVVYIDPALTRARNEHVHPIFAGILNSFFTPVAAPIIESDAPIVTHFMFEGPMSEED